MKRISRIFLSFLFLSTSIVFGSDKMDSIYANAEKNLYKNPDFTIQVSNDIIKQSISVDEKMNFYILLSTAYLAKRDYETSLNVILEAKGLLKYVTNVKNKTNVLLQIAIQYQQMQLYSKSLETLDEAEILAPKVESDNAKFSILGRIYAVRGIIYKSQSNPELALDKFNQSISYFNQLTHKASPNQSVVYYNIGYSYMILNDLDNAKKAFEKSSEFAKIGNAKSLLAFANKGMAEVYFAERNYTKALELLNEAEILSNEIGDLMLNEGIFEEKAKNYLALNQFENYKLYNQKFQKITFERNQNELQSISKSIDYQFQSNLEETDKLIEKT
ncbi:MAG: hypothetical protein KIG88_03715 [Weeksellaceae bacterium]|nr:hypothetical protein [Weeksellaceae bacterium]